MSTNSKSSSKSTTSSKTASNKDDASSKKSKEEPEKKSSKKDKDDGDKSKTSPSSSISGSGTSGTSSRTKESEDDRMTAKGKPDTLNTEFVYYSTVLKDLCSSMTNELDKKKILPWTRKLFRPEYHSSQFREKRNKFLMYLTLTLLNDEVFGMFKIPPPMGALPDFDSMEKPEFPAAEWEKDSTWADTVNNLTEDFNTLGCSVHCMQAECDEDHDLDIILDQEFQLFLYLLKPYAAMFTNTYDRTKIATWMQTLCSITGNMCSSMRGIRNDYMIALLSYAQDLRLAGPFAEYPPIRKLPPLAEAVKLAPNSGEPSPITDPTGPDATDFLALQPVPEEGAFCYIALTGDLIASSLTDG